MKNGCENLRQAKKLARETMQRRERRFLKKYGEAPEAELLSYVRRCAEELGFTPNAGDIVGAALIKERFGGWRQVLEQAGLEVTPKSARAGVPGIFEREVRRQLEYHQRAVLQIEEQERDFGRLHETDADEQLLAYLRSWAARLERSPNACEVVGGEYIKRRFGGWRQALEQAGLPQPPGNPPKRWHRLVYRDALRRQYELDMEIRRKLAEKGG